MRYDIFIISKTFLFIYFLSFFCSCRKIVQISPPVSSIVTSQVFSSDDQANSAIAGIYYSMLYGNGSVAFGSGAISLYCGLSADELRFFSQGNNAYTQFQNNEIQSINGNVATIWNSAYFSIYQANAAIEGLNVATAIHDSVSKVLTGEAKFIRAFCNFYLVNLFGDIPLVTTINWRNTALLSRTPSKSVYDLIISDLKDAQSVLPTDYSWSGRERIRPNFWAATALLARAYLYNGDWIDAETESSKVITNTELFNLVQDPNQVFGIQSTEAIWQLKQNSAYPPYNATIEGNLVVPFDSSSNAAYRLTPSLMDAFEAGDIRKSAWVDSTNYFGIESYYPYKYKTGPSQENPNQTPSEYYMMLRLAEQYLIRAEARVNEGGNKLVDAAIDLNIIRYRAHLPSTTATSGVDLLKAIMHERQIEFFAEWGHRWLDLKRTGQAQTVLPTIKPYWNINAELYPIPLGERNLDPNLSQNPGYQ